MTANETVLVLASAVAGAAFGALRLARFASSPALILLAGMIGCDVIGGAVCNATETTKAWYHRPGQTLWSHATFVLPHLLYIVLVAGLLRGDVFDSSYAAVVAGLLLVSATLILLVTPYLKRPVAFVLYLLNVLLIPMLVGDTPGIEWFVPTLFLKLLVGHLVP